MKWLDIYSKYKQFRNRLSNQLKRAKLFYLSSLADRGSPNKRFWDYVKSLSGRPFIPDTMQYNETSADNWQDIGNIFSHFFAEWFNPYDVDVSENRVAGVYPKSGKLSTIECSAKEAYKLISL